MTSSLHSGVIFSENFTISYFSFKFDKIVTSKYGTENFSIFANNDYNVMLKTIETKHIIRIFLQTNHSVNVYMYTPSYIHIYERVMTTQAN